MAISSMPAMLSVETLRTEVPGRVVEIKRPHDPTSLFHLNQNIPPEPAAGG